MKPPPDPPKPPPGPPKPPPGPPKPPLLPAKKYNRQKVIIRIFLINIKKKTFIYRMKNWTFLLDKNFF